MRRLRTTYVVVGTAAILVAGGASIAAFGSSSAPYSAVSPTPRSAAPAGTTTLHTVAANVDGKKEQILVDSTGLPLYIYEPDTATESHVSGQLAALWPPLTAATPTSAGVSGALSTVRTGNGQQVAYNGHFLYTFVQDSPGKVTGQGVQNFYVATPDLSAASGGTISGSGAAGY